MQLIKHRKKTGIVIGDLDICKVNDLSDLFAYSDFNEPLTNWNTNHVYTMERMFENNTAFNQPLDHFEVNGVILRQMFSGASAFNQPLESWDMAGAQDLSYMFYGTKAFNQPLNNWNTHNVKNMSYMFFGSSFNQSLDNWNTDRVTNMDNMFWNSSIEFKPNTEGVCDGWKEMNPRG